MSLLIGFSGQGFQHAQMFDRLKNNEKGKLWVEEASEIIHLNLLDENIIEKYLYDSVYAQLFISLLSVGVFRLLEQANLKNFMDVRLCGYSLGETSAFCASAGLSLEELCETVERRALFMKKAAELKGDGGLGVLKGNITLERVQVLTQKYGCYIAIINDNDHYIVGGLKSLLEPLLEEAKKQGVNKAEPLLVNLPSHTPILAEASINFLDYLKIFKNKRLRYSILNALTGELKNNTDEIISIISNELSHTLYWQKVMAIAKEYNIIRFLELGPKSSLKNMAQPYFSETYAVEDFSTIEGLIHYFS
jgi:[acyl-carrier-protein] S-malonyltransferase